MRSSCIVITCEYPFLTGEAFLENEMPYLSKTFDNIYIFTLNASESDKMTRTPPKNAKVFPLGCLLSKMRYPVYITRGIFTANRQLKCFSPNLKKTAVSLYEKGRSGRVLRKMEKIIEENRLDVHDAVIYSYWFTDQAVAAWELRDRLNEKGAHTKAVARGHGYDIYWERNALGFLPFQDISLKKLDGFFPCSDNGKNYLSEKYPRYASRIETARLGTSDYGYKPEAEGKTIVTCCSLYPFKRISLFARAFKLVCEKADCRWVCIGDGAELEEVKNYVSENGLSDRVTFTGRLPNSEVIRFYKENDIYLFSNISLFEGVPVCIMEALSFGIPVAATAAGGTGELVNENNGVLLDLAIDEETLARALIAELSLSEDEYRQKRENARKTWEEKSSADINFSRWCKMLAE